MAITKKGWITRKNNGNGIPWNKNKKTNFNGPNNSCWKGGTWPYWRKQALMRDEYVCQICGFSDKEIMQVDHILPAKYYPELYLDINNLQVVCPNYHARKTLYDKRKYKQEVIGA